MLLSGTRPRGFRRPAGGDGLPAGMLHDSFTRYLRDQQMAGSPGPASHIAVTLSRSSRAAGIRPKARENAPEARRHAGIAVGRRLAPAAGNWHPSFGIFVTFDVA